jgi:hypothetical protein
MHGVLTIKGEFMRFRRKFLQRITNMTLIFSFWIEGVFYLIGIIATLIDRHFFLLDPRFLLIYLGIELYRKKRLAKTLALIYSILALVGSMIFKSELILFEPDSRNIFYIVGLVFKPELLKPFIVPVIILAIIIRFIQLLCAIYIVRYPSD